MASETSEWLNRNVLAGFTQPQQQPWWYPQGSTAPPANPSLPRTYETGDRVQIRDWVTNVYGVVEGPCDDGDGYNVRVTEVVPPFAQSGIPGEIVECSSHMLTPDDGTREQDDDI